MLTGREGLAFWVNAIRYVITDKSQYSPMETIKVTEEVDATPDRDVRVETNLIDEHGQIINGTAHYLNATAGDEPFTVFINIPSDTDPGEYEIMAILYDAYTHEQLDIMFVPVTILELCLNPYHGGYILFSQRNCGGFDPPPIQSYMSPPGYAGGNLEYKWQYSTDYINYTDIPGSNMSSYDPGFLEETTYFRRLARVDCKNDWTGAAISHTVILSLPTPSLLLLPQQPTP